MSDKTIINLHSTNRTQEKLDYDLSQFLLDFAKEHPITNDDIAGVFETIKFRMYYEGL